MRRIDADLLKEQMESVCMGIMAGTDSYNAPLKTIDDAPTIEVPKWIPVSEGLPSDEDYDETFTVTIQCEHYDGWDDYVTGYADWTPHGWDIQSYYLGQIKVVAWMPLPEPYKERG